jgi:hypothetical protein
MSEPAKPTDSAAKATDDLLTKYKVRLTPIGPDANPPPRLQEVEKIIDFVAKPFWFPLVTYML